MFNSYFRMFATCISKMVGKPQTFALAITIIITWSFSRRFFVDQNTWQLVINTFTTIVTFLMVFLIQNTQNRDAKATQLKLDELLRAVRGARNTIVNIEDLDDAELEEMHQEFKKIQEVSLRRKELSDQKKADQNFSKKP